MGLCNHAGDVFVGSSLLLIVQMPGINCGGRLDWEFEFSFALILLKMGPLVKALLSMPPSTDGNCVAVAMLFVVWEDDLLAGIVRGLEIRALSSPPTMAREANAVWGTNWPKTTVAPTNGAPSSQKRAQHMVEKAQIFFFSLLTNSTVQVVKMDRVHDMAILEIIADSISSATRPLIGTGEEIKQNM